MEGKKKLLKILSAFFMLSGIIVLGFIFAPIIRYNLDPSIRLENYISPVPDSALPDLTKASNWFVDGKPKDEFTMSKVTAYNISIPALKIENAVVNIGGEDLSQSLIQYPGTALPGKIGNSVIFGHSILPQFYNPKNYLSIFSTLPALKKNDQINIQYDGITYRYEVEDKFEVLPTNLEVLEQSTDDSYLSLVTCVPPGDPARPRRLVVRARIMQSKEI
jgi:sortase A